LIKINYFNKEANAYLKEQSSEMKALIELTGPIETFHIEDPFIALISQIVYQSISLKAADTIWARFTETIYPLTPAGILSYSFEDIKTIGLSGPKTAYIFNVANAYFNQEINTNFNGLTDIEIIKEVTKIKGIGEWTAQMLLIFCLDRPNVMAYKDFAIRKGLEWLYDIDHSLTKKEFNYYKTLFSPYGTTASLYLWEIHAKTKQQKI
jgi:3-methyladenine DNA glycosylase/8-oxoguanine DNA glycosylase